MKLKVKVCGMRQVANLEGLEQLAVDFVGLIFYDKSPRFVEAKGFKKSRLKTPFRRKAYVKDKIEKVGVFVNAALEDVLAKVKAYQLDYVQLHGQENVFYCRALKKAGVKIIKAFSVDKNFSFTLTEVFQYDCDFFLFDTKGENPGGNGVSFDWNILQKYKGSTPFFLSGGIQPNMVEEIRALNLPQLYAVDLNSGFEIKPGFKDISILSDFIYQLQKPSPRATY